MLNATLHDEHIDTHSRELGERIASASERRPRNTISPVTATLAGISFVLAMILVALYLQS